MVPKNKKRQEIKLKHHQMATTADFQNTTTDHLKRDLALSNHELIIYYYNYLVVFTTTSSNIQVFQLNEPSINHLFL